jgi:RNA polymerase sigma factor (sigma-70 family)
VSSRSQRNFVTAIEQKHGRQLRRFLALHLRRASADVPDLFQEIFLRLLRIKDHEAIRNPQAYLYTIANHVLHQHSLQRAGQPESMDPLEVASSSEQATVPDPAEELELAEQLEALGKELLALSPRAYAALVMYRCEGMTLMEIGERLGVSHVMARRYLARAIAYCDERLAEQAQGARK